MGISLYFRGFVYLAVLLFNFASYADESAEHKTKKIYSCARLLTDAVPVAWTKKMSSEGRATNPLARRLRDNAQLSGFDRVALNAEILRKHTESYTFELARGPITNQRRSGRCWIFAGLNMVRSQLIAENKVPENFEFSENYLYFFSLLEKSNQYFEEIIEKTYSKKSIKKLKHPENSTARKVAGKFAPDLGDGGWYEYFMFLVSKYGVVPKQAMPDTKSAESTEKLQQELKNYLASAAAQILVESQKVKKNLGKSKSKMPLQEYLTYLRSIKEHAMSGVWKILATHLGDPPRKFEYRVTEPVVRQGLAFTTPTKLIKFTPKIFARKFVRFNPRDFVVVTSYTQIPTGQVYTIQDTAIGPAQKNSPHFDLRFMNVPVERMEELTILALEGAQPVWFAADITKSTDHSTGIMHPEISENDPVYNLDPQEQMLELPRQLWTHFGLASPNHAMLLTGFDRPDPNNPVIKFKNENSWGDGVGSKGIYHLYRDWFHKYVFQVIVHKKFLNKAEFKAWESPAILLPKEAEDQILGPP